MKVELIGAIALSLISNAVSSRVSPISKVLSMISDLEANIIKEGETVQKEYEQFAEWCEDRSRNLGFEIKTGKSQVESLKATIAEEQSTSDSLSTKVEELVETIAANEADLKAATVVREQEAADFSTEEKQLMETIDMLSRATSILEREMQGGASMLQLKNAGNLVQVFDAMVGASLIATGDATKLTALIQESNDDDDVGAPAATVYSSQSGGVVGTLDDLAEKADSQLAESRKKETTSRNNFELLKQSLVDENKVATQSMDESKKGIAASAEKKSTAEGDLKVTSKELAEDVKAKGTLHQDCVSKAGNFEAETKSRGEELKTMATAKKIIKEATGAALDQVSLVQLHMSSSKDLDRYEAVRLVRDVAHKHHSNALVQLASKMAAAMHSRGAFDKVKNMVSDMIAKLEGEADADASKKKYCDKELAETNEKNDEKTDDIETMTTRIDKMSATSAQLKEEVAVLENQLSKLAKSQAKMDQLRQKEKETYEENKAVLEKGLTGIQTALKVLNEYYSKDDQAHDASQGGGSGIIGLLEVIEADYSKNSAEITADEEQGVSEYEQETKETELDKIAKDQDVTHKTQESKELDKFSAELKSDRKGAQSELDAILEYLAKIEEECIAKPQTYEQRKARRDAELAGLKQALDLLESEIFVQLSARKTLRGSHHLRSQ